MTNMCARGCGRSVDRPTGNYGTFTALAERLEIVCDECFAEDERLEAERTVERERSLLDRRVERSGVPRRHRRPLEALDHPQEILGAAGGWSENGGGLLLTGDVGVGKTTIAGAAAYRFLVRGGSLAWTSAPLLFARLGSGWNTEQREQALAMLTGRDALVLDDIDKTRPTAYAAEHVFLAVDQRVEHGIPLLVTSNLTLDGIAEHWEAPFGEAIASRLTGYCRAVRVGGVDRRLG